MRLTLRQSVRRCALLAVAIGLLSAPAAQAAVPCCQIVPLASVAALPSGFSPSLAVSIARPAGYASGPAGTLIASSGSGRNTYTVAAGAKPVDGSAPQAGLRAAALGAVGSGKRIVDAQVTVRHEVPPSRGLVTAPVGVGSLPGFELIASGARPGTYSGSFAFALSKGAAAPVVVIRIASVQPCCGAAALRALRAALDGIALEGNLPATDVVAKLQPANGEPCCAAVLNGTVRDGFGEPLVGMSVSLAPAGAQPCCGATTDALGAYSLPLPKSLRSGSYTLTVNGLEPCCASTQRLQLNFANAAPATSGPLNLLAPNQRWVVAHPRIVNLFWDNDWTGHNAWSRHTVDVATRDIAVSHYFDDVGQYGVARPSWLGSHSPSVFCGARRAPTSVSSARLAAWVSCEVSTLHPQSRLPVSEDLFVVYLPQRTTVTDPRIPKFSVLGQTFGPFALPAQCTGWAGYHFASLSVTGPFAFAVVPSKCANGDLRKLTETASHELVEAMTDPVLTAGWIDDSYSLAPPTFDRLLKGEAGDICDSIGSHPTPSASVMGGKYLISPYWSNAAGACVAHF